MDRRDFTKVMGVVVAGMAAGTKAFAADEKPAEKPDTHVCKGRNDCKGKGGCAADAAKHECAKKNACGGMGGCKAGDKGCAGKNSCKGKGGCKVPIDATHVDKAAKSSCKGKSGCKS